MAMSALFDIEDGMKYVKSDPAALQFELGRCYGIEAWVERAFYRLMKDDLSSLTLNEVSQIGLTGFFWLARTKARIQSARNTIAFNVPPLVNAEGCRTVERCMEAWKCEWEYSVRQLLHHPEQPISCVDLLDQLRNSHIAGLCYGCQDLTVTWLWGKSLFTDEERFVEQAIAELMKVQRDEPIRAALRDSVAGVKIEIPL
ncbi:hypothetical protein R3P38DRAFT_3332723 [Favolaschia claudopus]|uniref:Uncharacterized protein n=1 Tax=Favolaschia claudopus TaxID=2862362 RepID=A0AAV9ZLD1_9AGAR